MSPTARAGTTGASTATLRVVLATPALAQQAGRALAPDHDGRVTWRVDANTLVLEARSDSALGLVRTLDDVLGCVRALGVA